jgi:hypothetical protein
VRGWIYQAVIFLVSVEFLPYFSPLLYGMCKTKFSKGWGMRSLLVLASVLSSLQAWGAPSVKGYALTCQTSVSTIRIYSDDSRLYFHLENPQGFENFPIFSGVVTPSVLPKVTRGANELAVFKGDVDISWDLSKCQVDPNEPLLAACIGRGEMTKPKTSELQVTSVSTDITRTQSLLLQSEARMIDVNIGLSTGDKNFTHYFLSFPFDDKHCAVSAPNS